MISRESAGVVKQDHYLNALVLPHYLINCIVAPLSFEPIPVIKTFSISVKISGTICCLPQDAQTKHPVPSHISLGNWT
jgi:hypothetical protein